MELNRNLVQSYLHQLASTDKKRQVFGAATHDYKLNPPLDVNAVASFEDKHGINLPEDYKRFITEIGNGGAGPAYGLFPFGQQDDNFGLRTLEGGHLVGDIGQPFRHSEAWDLDDEFWANEPDPPEGISEDEEDRLWEEWDKALEAVYWNPAIMNGAIPICHLGCAQRQWLVVNGEQRGFVWDDMRADNGGLVPLRSQKLCTKIKAGTLSEMPLDVNPFTDWSAHLFAADRTQYFILSNTQSLYSCVMLAKGVSSTSQFIEKGLGCIREFMGHDGHEVAYRKYIAPSIAVSDFAKALNRTVTGSMNELIKSAELWLAEGDSPHEVGCKLNDILLSALATDKPRRYGQPNEAFNNLVNSSRR